VWEERKGNVSENGRNKSFPMEFKMSGWKNGCGNAGKFGE
jgi:hypothetical protein